MQLIHDGYTQRAELDALTFLYRPMVYSDAVGACKIVQSLPKEMHKDFLFDVVSAYVVWPDQLDRSKVMQGRVLADMLSLITGDRQQERKDEENLRTGSMIAIAYPHLDRVSCADCKYWWFDINDGEFCKRGDVYLKRDGHPPCDIGVKCPVGHWTQEKRLSEKNREAFRHYMLCRKAGVFPDDPIVRRNARIISEVIEKCQRKSKMLLNR